MQIIDIPTHPSRTTYEGREGYWETDHRLVTPHGNRVAVGGWDETGKGRIVFEGPEVPGPVAYTYGLGVAITADPRMSTAYEREQDRAAGREHRVETGDLVRLDGHVYRVRIERREYVYLDVVTGTELARLDMEEAGREAFDASSRMQVKAAGFLAAAVREKHPTAYAVDLSLTWDDEGESAVQFDSIRTVDTIIYEVSEDEALEDAVLDACSYLYLDRPTAEEWVKLCEVVETDRRQGTCTVRLDVAKALA